jgi:hypothetical protein
MQISEPGIYRDFDGEAYFADPCPTPSISQSMCKTLIEQSPLHAKMAHPRLAPPVTEEDETAEKYDQAKAIGNATHSMVLKRGKKIAIIDAPNFQTKAAKEAKAAAILDGCEPVLKKHAVTASAMCFAANEQLAQIEGCERAFIEGDAEVVIANCENGLWLRSMTFQFAPAVREQVSLLIALAGAVGSGKTFSALRLAKGMAPSGKIAFIDTEARRGLHYAEQFKFMHADMRPPFRPAASSRASAPPRSRRRRGRHHRQLQPRIRRRGRHHGLGRRARTRRHQIARQLEGAEGRAQEADERAAAVPRLDHLLPARRREDQDRARERQDRRRAARLDADLREAVHVRDDGELHADAGPARHSAFRSAAQAAIAAPRHVSPTPPFFAVIGSVRRPYPFRSRRFSSRSTASRMKSVRSSPSARTASMRSKVPSAKRATMSSLHIFLRPIDYFSYEVLTTPIISHMIYPQSSNGASK